MKKLVRSGTFAPSRRDVLKIAGASLLTPLCSPLSAEPSDLIQVPYLQNVCGDRATVVWASRSPGYGKLVVDTANSVSQILIAKPLEFQPGDTGLSYTYYQYRAEVRGLSADADYRYRVQKESDNGTTSDPAARSSMQGFRASGGPNFQFLVFGDSGSGTGEQQALSVQMAKEPASFVLVTGDLVYPSASFAGFQSRYLETYRDILTRAPFFPAPGNHDYDLDNGLAYIAAHAVPTEGVPEGDAGRYYSFDRGEIHFVSLDSNAPLAAAVNGTGKMLEWLDADLKKSRKYWKIVYFHHPPYASGAHDGDLEVKAAVQNVVPILERNGVQIVFNGHEHSYQRTKPIARGSVTEDGSGISYITTGGGGAGLHEITPQDHHAAVSQSHHYLRCDAQSHQITIRAIQSPDGTVLDKFTIAPKPELSENAVVSAGSYLPNIGPGSLISVFGRNLAFSDARGSGDKMPVELAGARVFWNGTPLPLFFASPRQVNAQLPFDATGQGTLRLTTLNGSVETVLTVQESAPVIFVVSHADGNPVSPSNVAKPLERLNLYGSGFGVTSGGNLAGQVAPPSPPFAISGDIWINLDGVLIRPESAVLAPGFAGIYKVIFDLPAILAPGAHMLSLSVNGVKSNRATLFG